MDELLSYFAGLEKQNSGKQGNIQPLFEVSPVNQRIKLTNPDGLVSVVSPYMEERIELAWINAVLSKGRSLRQH